MARGRSYCLAACQLAREVPWPTVRQAVRAYLPIEEDAGHEVAVEHRAKSRAEVNTGSFRHATFPANGPVSRNATSLDP